jgi:diguanylate cyclase (GGDEF)-like protein
MTGPTPSAADLEEAEFIRARLREGRPLIRMACLLGLAVVILRAGEVVTAHDLRPPSLPGWNLLPALVVSASLALTAIAWSPLFMRWYLPAANVLVPTRNVFASIAIGVMAAQGYVELLMILPAMVLGPFFLLGMRFRPALACVVFTLAAFTTSGAAVGLSMPVLLRSSGFLLATAAISAVAAWQIERQARRSFQESRAIRELAQQDALTGAKNRRVFDDCLARLWRQAIDDRRRIAILLIDVDCFKAYNDCYGHQAGDLALQRVADAVQAQIRRPLDLLCRYGGEEFAVLLYDVEPQNASEIAERMRAAIEALGIEHRGSTASRKVTVSIGVAAVQPVSNRDPSGALQLADEALYAAKMAGRNVVHAASDADYRNLQTGVFEQQAANG